MKKEHLYIAGAALSILALLIFEWVKPKPVDWTESYTAFDKKPYGCYIMRNVLGSAFPNQRLQNQNEPIFTSSNDSSETENVIYINSSFAPDSIEAQKLLREVDQGQTVFISAKTIGGFLADTLGIATSSPPKLALIKSRAHIKDDSLGLNFANPSLHKHKPWYYYKATAAYHFSGFDTSRTTVLSKNSEGMVNFIKMKVGKGAFLLHSVPFAFTNFYMRDEAKARYAFNALSYLPVAPTVWDEYYKQGRSVRSSPLRYIMSQTSFRWAWITALVGLILFLIFRAKRRQRIIPHIERPKNTTVEFVATIGRLYHENSSRKALASKRIGYLMAYLRDHLKLDAHEINDDFIEKVSRRSGISSTTISALFSAIHAVRQKSSLSKRELWDLNDNIETFYNQTLR